MRKRTYTHVNEYETIILSMRQEGCTRREIADELGLSVRQIEGWITRYNKREALLLAEKNAKLEVVPEKMASHYKNKQRQNSNG